MKHIYSTRKHNSRKWVSHYVDVEQLPISKTEIGDLVYIAGNLVDGFATVIYGPHKIYNKETMELINKKGRVFYERMEVYREIQ